MSTVEMIDPHPDKRAFMVEVSTYFKYEEDAESELIGIWFILNAESKEDVARIISEKNEMILRHLTLEYKSRYPGHDVLTGPQYNRIRDLGAWITDTLHTGSLVMNNSLPH